jgi:hypothetical protein
LSLLSLEELVKLGSDFYLGVASINTPAAQHSRDELCDMLVRTAQNVGNLVENWSQEQVDYCKPGKPEGWDSSGDETHFNASEIVTHLAQSYGFFWYGVTRALGESRPQLNKPPKETHVTGQPGKLFGRGGWGGVPGPDLKQLLVSTAESFARYMRSLPEDVDTTANSSYDRYGDLTARAWLLLASVHTVSHLEQLREIQSQPDFPK